MTDEAKRIIEALRYCSKQTDGSGCGECPAYDVADCDNLLFSNTADLIESLTAEVEELRNANAGLDRMLCSAQSAAETFERRARAAEKDLILSGTCAACANWNPQCNLCDETNGFVWRGPCKESGGVE